MERKRCLFPVLWAESSLHSRPEKLNARLAELLKEADPAYKTVLFAFGVCGNGLTGLEAGCRTLVTPMVPDCIPLFLGSNEKRAELGIDAYFFTEGYLRGERDVLNEYRHCVKRYGEARALRIVKSMMRPYRRFVVVDTGAFDVHKTTEKTKEIAALFDIPVMCAKGNLCLMEDLIDGNWSGDKFLITPPGQKITFQDSLRAATPGLFASHL